MDWRGILVGDVAWVGNFAVWICVDGRYEETTCDIPDDVVLKIPIEDGDGDSTDDVSNHIGDDSVRCDDSDDWPVVVDDDNDDDDDDDAKYDVCIDGDNEGGGGDITDDDEENDIDTVTDEDDDETVGVAGA